jgi:hypothetical protein
MTVRVTHTPCAQPVDLTDDNQVLTPATDVPHRCPVSNGPFQVIRWGTSWSIEDVLDSTKKHPRYATQAEATTEADRRNQTYNARHAPRPPQPEQPDLFSNQEAI